MQKFQTRIIFGMSITLLLGFASSCVRDCFQKRMVRSLLLFTFLVTVAVVRAFSQLPEPRFEDLVHEFDYDPKAQLAPREAGRQKRGAVTIIDLSYASPRGGRVPAYLVVPAGQGPFAAILFGHWMMPGSPLRSRRQFLDEAVVLARSGAVSLLIDAPLVRPGFVLEKDEMRAQVQSAEASRQQVIDFRRGVDLLTARPDVDPTRIAYVGHSYDAHIGGILSAVEKRIGSFVLMAGGFSDEEYVFDPDNTEMQKVRQRLGVEILRDFFRKYAFDDPVHFVGHSAPASVFLQFGSEDKPIPEKLARHYYDLFSEPKKIEFYKAGHALNSEARTARVQWLVERLALRLVDSAALARIPQLK
jgi:dienelactone hydrolase